MGIMWLWRMIVPMASFGDRESFASPTLPMVDSGHADRVVFAHFGLTDDRQAQG
jgi:hypothetical protein